MLAPGILLAAALLSAAPPPLHTEAERSGFRVTGRYAEVEALCRAFAGRYPAQVRCVTFAVTLEGRPMLALIASADGTLTPEAALAKKRPVVLAQGGIHAGEIDGKDAGFWALRELLDGTAPATLLRQVTFVFVPVLNVDGHERFGPNNRPNQRGPEQMGWRVNAQNLNLNRDYVKLDTPELAALLGLMNAWRPILYLDLHVTDGSKFQHEVAVMIQPAHAGSSPLRPHGRKLQDDVFAALLAQGHRPLEFYPSLRDEDDPASGFTLGVAPPRFSQSYWAHRNRIGVLVETHSWKEYPVRVKATHDVLLAFLSAAAKDGAKWEEASQEADAADRAAKGGELVLRWKASERSRTIDFQGYAYQRAPSDVSGKTWVRYDESKPQVWQVPYFSELQEDLLTRVPKAGWAVPAGYADAVARRLRLHGFRYDVLTAARTADVQVFRATEVSFSAQPFEGRQQAKATGQWRPEKVLLPEGSLFVPANQPGRLLLAHLFEPAAPDSLVSWGFFNAAFEQKEYLEGYLLEAFARELLAKDPRVRAAFEARLSSDPAFAKDPAARLRFFAERHPAWDPLLNRVPAFRVEQPLAR